jgi:hypothetical protein
MKERKKDSIIKMLKILPLNSNYIYLSCVVTPILQFAILSYIPSIIVYILLKAEISKILIKNQISIIKFNYLIHFALPLIIILGILLIINFELFLKSRIKKMVMISILSIVIIFIYLSNEINLLLKLDFDITKLKQLFVESEPIYPIQIALLIITVLIICLLIFGLKSFKKRIYREL